MNDGVAMLIERMKTHPEEFANEGTVSKWEVLINEYRDVLDVLDVKKLDNARRTLLQQRFTEKVMEELIDPKMLTTEEWDARYNYPNTPIAGVTQTV